MNFNYLSALLISSASVLLAPAALYGAENKLSVNGFLTQGFFYTDQNNVYVQDLGSTNGTYRNKIKITESEPVQVLHSDHIYLGSWESGGVELRYTSTSTRTTKDTRSMTRKTVAKNI